MFVSFAGLAGAPAVTLGVVADAFSPRRLRAEPQRPPLSMLTHVNAFVTQAFASSACRASWAGPQTATRAPHCYPVEALVYS